MYRRRARVAVIAGLVAVAATGCIKADMQLELQADDTVDGSMIVAFDKSLADMMGEDLDSMQEQMLGESGEGLPDDAKAEEYEDDKYIGSRFTFTDAPLAEFNDGDMSITHESDEFIVSGSMDASSGDLGEQGDLGNLGGLGGMAEPDIVLAITFPGEVLEHNGELDGTTVTWRPSLGENVEISARARYSGGSGLPTWLWAIVGVVVVAAIIGGIFWFSRRRQNAQAPHDQFSPVPADATPDVPPPAHGDTRELPRLGDEPPPPQPR